VFVPLEGDRWLAGLVLADGDGDQPMDVLADDLPDAPLDLSGGLVVAPAEPVADPGELVFGLLQRALAGGGDLARLLG